MGSIEPDVQEARIGRSQPGVGLLSQCFFVLQPGVGLLSQCFFVLHFFESGLTLNPHNKRHSFGIFLSLYLSCVVDSIKRRQRTEQPTANTYFRKSCNHLLKI